MDEEGWEGGLSGLLVREGSGEWDEWGGGEVEDDDDDEGLDEGDDMNKGKVMLRGEVGMVFRVELSV